MSTVLARRLTLLVSIFLLVPSLAFASASRTFVSGAGNDANACSIVAPCRSLGAALAQTNSAGEIVVLDSAGYGPVTIGKSVSITAPQGVYAGITTATDGVTINTPSIIRTLNSRLTFGLLVSCTAGVMELVSLDTSS